MNSPTRSSKGARRKKVLGTKKHPKDPRRGSKRSSSPKKKKPRGDSSSQSPILAPPPPLLPLSQIHEANPVGKRGNLLAKKLNPPPKTTPSNSSAPPNLRYGVLFFSTFQQAHRDTQKLAETAPQYDQLNVVIAEEGDMQDATLLQTHPHIRVFAGSAWHLIHQRRAEEGWYEDHKMPVLENATTEENPSQKNP